ncbi:hypothetical protein TSAR_013747 [Trichomalopsis sarcophagae]|uniref:Uncharacterized protein n=1 Tax=Trichomalopsis sarcophagae TaxID=543379 RepID=A0A232FN78_9HYME|nr:hypothetical protein TSAR_013747 [Trichomalopsis sarcophagae]
MAQIQESQDGSVAGCTVQFEMILTMIDVKVVKSNTQKSVETSSEINMTILPDYAKSADDDDTDYSDTE